MAAFVRRFPQVHLGIGLLGNTLFIVGSVLFMTDHESVGVYSFLCGSCGMFVGTSGEILRNLGRRHLERLDVDPWAPDQSLSDS